MVGRTTALISSSSGQLAGEALAISVPKTEAAVIRHFQERMPYGLFVLEVLWRKHYTAPACYRYKRQRGRLA